MKNLTINVGEYVRTKDGVIGKIVRESYEKSNEYLLDTLYYDFDEIVDKWTCGVMKWNIIKSSPNIIDLIEVGDYVNGNKVYYLKGQVPESDINCKEDVLYTEYIDEYGEWYGYEEDEIETIVTKEQFESMEYKI